MDEITREQLMIPADLQSPYALFIGDGIGWVERKRAGAQVLILLREAPLNVVMDFVGSPMIQKKLEIGGRKVTVCARLAAPRDRVALNVLGHWLLGEDHPAFVGAMVVLQDMELS